MILEDLRNFEGGGVEPSNPPRYATASWNPLGPSGPVTGLFYHYTKLQGEYI